MSLRLSEQYGQGDIAPACGVRVINPSMEEWSLWIHPVSFVPARVQGDIYAPHSSTSTTVWNQRTASCSSHARWGSVEGILNVADRDDSGPIALLDQGRRYLSVCARPTCMCLLYLDPHIEGREKKISIPELTEDAAVQTAKAWQSRKLMHGMISGCHPLRCPALCEFHAASRDHWCLAEGA
ncbi:hypothetical protein B0H14DRAFT_2637209 [Mycena olivaceomarginata]|nr:hypothetical protein B0H14DRAFT_2637209 [Mycena olivaceomarginata]